MSLLGFISNLWIVFHFHIRIDLFHNYSLKVFSIVQTQDGGIDIYQTFDAPPPNTIHKITMQLLENRWRNITNNQTITRQTMLEIFSLPSSDVTISISASPIASSDSGYIVRISEITYEMLTLDTVTGTPSDGNNNRPIEKCHCPVGYIGASCQECADGFHQMFNPQLGIKQCVICQCNGHSTICNKRTGQCQNCQDNTVGDQCQLCRSGFYGNATVGGVDSCQRCPCGAPNTVTPMCVQSESTGNITCLNCSEGYIGRLCMGCDVGYFKAGMFYITFIYVFLFFIKV